MLHDAVAQNNPEIKCTYHWYFGDKAGIDFSSGIAVSDTMGSLKAGEGVAAVSDTSGNLLFYTNGIAVWNSIHDTMPNGVGLLGGPSSTQAALIVPNPINKNQFYIFTSDDFPPNNNGYRYSIVDMTLDSGHGDIIYSSKNILLLPNSTEKLVATQHCNKIDYWVITHSFNSNSFYTFLVDSNGIESPIVSNIGLEINNNNNGASLGYIKVSPNGKKIAMTLCYTDTIQIFDFNNKTGVISNPLTLVFSNPSNSIYGITFSPNSKMFYVLEKTYYNLAKLWQFDLSNNDSSFILDSKILIENIGDSTNSLIQIQPGALQIASDKKIYLAVYDATGSIAIGNALGIIQFPDSSESKCNFILNGLNLNGRACLSGLPNFIDSYFIQDTASFNCSNVSVNNLNDLIFMVYPNPVNDYIRIYSSKLLQKIEIYDMLGQLVFEKKLINETTSSEVFVECINFKPGIYQLIVFLDGIKTRLYKKIIILK